MQFDDLVKALLEEFNPPYDQRRRGSRTFASQGNDISNSPKTTSVTSAYDNKLAPAIPSKIPGGMFYGKEELKRRARRRRK